MKKISFDLHGVIDSKPIFFKSLIHQLKKEHFKVYITTGARRFEASSLLNKLGVEYDVILSVTEFLFCSSIPFKIKGDGIFFDDSMWCHAKNDLCLLNDIQLHIDNQESYLRHFCSIDTFLYKEGSECQLKAKIKEIF